MDWFKKLPYLILLQKMPVILVMELSRSVSGLSFMVAITSEMPSGEVLFLSVLLLAVGVLMLQEYMSATKVTGS